VIDVTIGTQREAAYRVRGEDAGEHQGDSGDAEQRGGAVGVQGLSDTRREREEPGPDQEEVHPYDPAARPEFEFAAGVVSRVVSGPAGTLDLHHCRERRNGRRAGQ
jgi:hypothetical protein